MFRCVRFPIMLLLLVVFTGCYTQIRAPREASVRESPPPPPAAEQPSVYWPTWTDMRFYAAWPMSPFYDPWDNAYYRSYRNRWTARIVLLYASDPFWPSTWRLVDNFALYEPWGGWSPMADLYPSLTSGAPVSVRRPPPQRPSGGPTRR